MPKPIIRTAAELEAYRDQVLTELVIKIRKALVAECRGTYGDVEGNRQGDGSYWISAENGMSLKYAGFQDTMHDIVSRHDRVIDVKKEFFEGSYDWAADVYIKPVSVVTFRLT